MAVNREQILQSAEKLLCARQARPGAERVPARPGGQRQGHLHAQQGRRPLRPDEPARATRSRIFTRIADFYSKDGFFLKAIAIYKKINKIDPARLEVYDRLADLYHKQGLVQDARSQYQVLADHYQKNNRVPDAITVYKKMAAIDPPTCGSRSAWRTFTAPPTRRTRP